MIASRFITLLLHLGVIKDVWEGILRKHPKCFFNIKLHRLLLHLKVGVFTTILQPCDEIAMQIKIQISYSKTRGLLIGKLTDNGACYLSGIVKTCSLLVLVLL